MNPTALIKGRERIYIHLPCGEVEWWNPDTVGSIHLQGCDRCDSAPDGQWRQVYTDEDEAVEAQAGADAAARQWEEGE